MCMAVLDSAVMHVKYYPGIDQEDARKYRLRFDGNAMRRLRCRKIIFSQITDASRLSSPKLERLDLFGAVARTLIRCV